MLSKNKRYGKTKIMHNLRGIGILRVALIFAVLFSFLLSSCSKTKTLTIAEQYGLAYAPIQIMRSRQYLEKLEPELNVEWVKLGNTAAIREAVLSGEVEIGVMGLPPFLIGFDKGMDWKIICGLSICPVGLVAGSGLDSLDDFTTQHRIALPQPGSIQHILLSMACDRRYGDASRFDNSLVTMKHPDGMTALLSGAVDAHFTSPPYIFLENKAIDSDGSKFKTILSGKEAFGGEFSFIGVMAAGRFLEDDPKLVDSFLKALKQSIDYIRTEPQKSAVLLSDIYQLPEDQLYEYITDEDIKYTMDIHGLETFIEFMTTHGYLNTKINLWDVTINE